MQIHHIMRTAFHNKGLGTANCQSCKSLRVHPRGETYAEFEILIMFVFNFWTFDEIKGIFLEIICFL